MSVLIKGMDMPTNCQHCPMSDDESRFCKATNEYIPMLGKPIFCPLLEEDTMLGEFNLTKELVKQKTMTYNGFALDILYAIAYILTKEGVTPMEALKILEDAKVMWQTQPPKKNGMYFVTTDKGGKRSVTMSGYRDEWIVEGVVAWMPIPEPFGGENGKNS